MDIPCQKDGVKLFPQPSIIKIVLKRLIGKGLYGTSIHEIWTNKLTTHGMQIRQGGSIAPSARDKNVLSTNSYKPKILSHKNRKSVDKRLLTPVPSIFEN